MLALVTGRYLLSLRLFPYLRHQGACGLTSLALAAGVGIVGRRAPRVGSSLLLWLCIRLVWQILSDGQSHLVSIGWGYLLPSRR